VKILAIESAFERALSEEIAASELLRVRVLAATLAVLLVAEQLLFLFARNLVEQVTVKPLPAWLPAQIIGPFLRQGSGELRCRGFSSSPIRMSRSIAKPNRRRSRCGARRINSEDSGPASAAATRSVSSCASAYWKFESIPLQRTVRLSPYFASARDKARVFRQFGDYAGRHGRQRRAKPRNIEPRGSSVSGELYSSTAVAAGCGSRDWRGGRRLGG
jgi:hypothetical protein